MKNNKKIITLGIIVLLLISCIGGYFILSQDKGSPKKTLETYVDAINKKDYNAAYRMIQNTKEWNKADFIKRVKNIYEGIDMSDLNIKILDSDQEGDKTIVKYKAHMNTVAGTIKYNQKISVMEDKKGYRLVWDSSQIIPELTNEERISVQVSKGERGSIVDRNGEVLAAQGTAFKVGFVAGAINDKEQAIERMATVLGISKESVALKLSASWIEEGMFVPIKTISLNDKQSLSEQLNQIDGASIQMSNVRVYPYGEMSSHITGYVQNISAEELKKHKNKGYDENSIIGKDGLERVYENDLKAKNGFSIVILNSDDSVKTLLISKDAENGKDIKTTIDINAQQVVYNQLSNDAGAGIMMDTFTGEVLAMVSTPSYNSNDFVLGLSDDEWSNLNNNDKTPLLNRVTSLYSPGSTFKAITGAIGIDTNTIQSDTTYEKIDRWQKDNSWGDNYVTTTKAYSEPSNLLNAFVNSDNIFFAQLADQIGKSKFSKYLDTIKFNQTIDFPLSLTKSSYGKLDSDQHLSAAGYGQGEILISPLHLTALYTAYKNEGTIVQPYLVYNENKKSVLVKNAYQKDTANLIFDDLKATMDSFGPNPTNAAGKTGTAQVNNGEQEIGWICTVNDRYALSIMIDDTKNIGQSHYVIPKAQAILASY